MSSRLCQTAAFPTSPSKAQLGFLLCCQEYQAKMAYKLGWRDLPGKVPKEYRVSSFRGIRKERQPSDEKSVSVFHVFAWHRVLHMAEPHSSCLIVCSEHNPVSTQDHPLASALLASGQPRGDWQHYLNSRGYRNFRLEDYRCERGGAPSP